MRIIVLIISLVLLAAPCLADMPVFDDRMIVVAASDGKKKPTSGKVVIKGKGGKVTDVQKKQGKSGKKSK